MTRSDEIFAADSGAVHPVHCPTRGDVAVCADGPQLGIARWQQVDKIEVRFEGHEGGQEQNGKRERADSKRSAGAEVIL